MRSIYERLFSGPKGLLVLVDPDRLRVEDVPVFVEKVQKNGAVKGFLVGTSILMSPRLDDLVRSLKNCTELPVVLFPGSAIQLTPSADALLYLVMVSGRNPELLIGEHVKAAPFIRHYNIEAISTAYILIESGTYTSVEFMSQTRPLPREKPEIALAHALAAAYLGVKAIYLEGGSGAKMPVPNDTIRIVKQEVSLPLIVGGGYRRKEDILSAFDAGADLVVVGTAIEQHWDAIETMV